MRRTLIRGLLIVVGGVAMGVAVNAVRADLDRDGKPRQLPWLTPPKPIFHAKDTVPLSEAESLWNSGEAFFLDARAAGDYATGHIALAQNLPAEAFEQQYPLVSTALTKDVAIIVYCDGEECELSHHVLAKLRALGYQNVRVLINGWTIWRAAGLPTTSGGQP